MATDESFAEFNNKRIEPLIDEWTNPKLRKLADKVGVQAKGIARKAASADLGGDPAFSGWRRGSPFPLDTRYDHVGPGVISFHPTKRAAGPWTVAEVGRNTAAGPRMVGPRLTKTGKVSRARVKRYNGRTAGKNTATDALTEIEREFPKLVDSEVSKAVRRFFD
jgi:hypothetical protein